MYINFIYENERAGSAPLHRKTGDGYTFITEACRGRDTEEIRELSFKKKKFIYIAVL